MYSSLEPRDLPYGLFDWRLQIMMLVTPAIHSLTHRKHTVAALSNPVLHSPTLSQVGHLRPVLIGPCVEAISTVVGRRCPSSC